MSTYTSPLLSNPSQRGEGVRVDDSSSRTGTAATAEGAADAAGAGVDGVGEVDASVVLFFFAREKLLFRYPTEDPFVIDVAHQPPPPHAGGGGASPVSSTVVVARQPPASSAAAPSSRLLHPPPPTAAAAPLTTAGTASAERERVSPAGRSPSRKSIGSADEVGGGGVELSSRLSKKQQQQGQPPARAALRRPASAFHVAGNAAAAAGEGLTTSAGSQVSGTSGESRAAAGAVASPNNHAISGDALAAAAGTGAAPPPPSATATATRRSRLAKVDRSLSGSTATMDGLSSTITTGARKGNKSVTVPAPTRHAVSNAASGVHSTRSAPTTCVGIHVNALLHLLRVSLQGCTTVNVGSGGTLLVFPLMPAAAQRGSGSAASPGSDACDDENANGAGAGEGGDNGADEAAASDATRGNSKAGGEPPGRLRKGSEREKAGGGKAASLRNRSSASTAMLVVAMRQPDTDSGAIARFVQSFVNVLCREERRAEYVSTQIDVMDDLTLKYETRQRAVASLPSDDGGGGGGGGGAKRMPDKRKAPPGMTNAGSLTSLHHLSGGNGQPIARPQPQRRAGMYSSFSTSSFGQPVVGSSFDPTALDGAEEMHSSASATAGRAPLGGVPGSAEEADDHAHAHSMDARGADDDDTLAVFGGDGAEEFLRGDDGQHDGAAGAAGGGGFDSFDGTFADVETVGLLTLRSHLPHGGGSGSGSHVHHHSHTNGSGGGTAPPPGLRRGRSASRGVPPQLLSQENRRGGLPRSVYAFLADNPQASLCGEIVAVTRCINLWSATARHRPEKPNLFLEKGSGKPTQCGGTAADTANDGGDGGAILITSTMTSAAAAAPAAAAEADRDGGGGSFSPSPKLPLRWRLPDGITVNGLIYLPLASLTGTGLGNAAALTGRSAAQDRPLPQFASVYGRLSPGSLLTLVDRHFVRTLQHAYVDVIGKKYAKLLPLSAVYACLTSLAAPWRVGAFYRSLERALVDGFRRRQLQARANLAAKDRESGANVHARPLAGPDVSIVERDTDVLHAITLHYAAGFTFLAVQIIEFLRLREAIHVDPEIGLWFTHGEVVSAEAMEKQLKKVARRGRKLTEAAEKDRGRRVWAAGGATWPSSPEGRPSPSPSSGPTPSPHGAAALCGDGVAEKKPPTRPVTLPSTLVLHMLTVMMRLDAEAGHGESRGGLTSGGAAEHGGGGGGSSAAPHPHGAADTGGAYPRDVSVVLTSTPSTGGTTTGNFPGSSPAESDVISHHGRRQRSVETSIASTPSVSFHPGPSPSQASHHRISTPVASQVLRRTTPSTASLGPGTAAAAALTPESLSSQQQQPNPPPQAGSGTAPVAVTALHTGLQRFSVYCAWGSACPLCEELASTPRAWTVPVGPGCGECAVTLQFPFLDPSVVTCANYIRMWRAMSGGGGHTSTGAGVGAHLLSGFGSASAVSSVTGLLSPESMRPWFLKPDMYMAPAATHNVSALRIFQRITSEAAGAAEADKRSSPTASHDDNPTRREGSASPQPPQQRTPSRPRQYISVEDEEGCVLLCREAVPAEARAWLRRFASTIEGRLDYARVRRLRLGREVAEAVAQQLLGGGSLRDTEAGRRESAGDTCRQRRDSVSAPRSSSSSPNAGTAAAAAVVVGIAATGTNAAAARSVPHHSGPRKATSARRERDGSEVCADTGTPGSPRSPQHMTDEEREDNRAAQWPAESAEDAPAAARRSNPISTASGPAVAVGPPSALLPTSAAAGSAPGAASPALMSASSPHRPRSMKYTKRLLPDRTALTPAHSFHAPLLGLHDAPSTLLPAAEYPAFKSRSSSSSETNANPHSRSHRHVDRGRAAAHMQREREKAAAKAREAAVAQLMEMDRYVPVEVLVQFATHHLVAFLWGRAGIDAELALRQLERNLRRLRTFLANFTYVAQLRRAGWTSKKAHAHMHEDHLRTTAAQPHTAPPPSPRSTPEMSATHTGNNAVLPLVMHGDGAASGENALPSGVPITHVDVQLLQTHELFDALSLLPCLAKYAGRPLPLVPTRLLLHTAVNEFSDAFLMGGSPADASP